MRYVEQSISQSTNILPAAGLPQKQASGARTGAYQAFEGDSKVAEFQWSYRDDGRLFLHSIRFEQGYETYHYFEQIMEFIRYKAHAVGQDAVYAEVAIQNCMLYEHLKRFGFYAIDQYLRQGNRGKQSIIRVMKYTV